MGESDRDVLEIDWNSSKLAAQFLTVLARNVASLYELLAFVSPFKSLDVIEKGVLAVKIHCVFFDFKASVKRLVD